MKDLKTRTLSPLRKLLAPRPFFLFISIMVQLSFVIGVILWFNDYFAFFYGFSLLLSVVAFLWVVNSRINSAYKIAWIIPIMLFPVFGGLFYLFMGRSKMNRKTAEQMRDYEDKTRQALMQQKEVAQMDVMPLLKTKSSHGQIQSQYINDFAGYPPFFSAESQYLPIGEKKFLILQEELKKARHYIFMEYFIIEEGVMWNGILEILKEKVSEGVDVRLIYDDVGCLFTLPYGYDQKLESMGIKCCVFNRLTPLISLRQNNRDHRKITVIDGCVGFTGGINLADEYINEIVKYGHWKDTGIMLKGPAVWSLTVMFLAMWDFLRGVEENFDDFRPDGPAVIPQQNGPEEEISNDVRIWKGIVQPFADSPLDDESVGESVYLNMIYRANKYVYITTPYLIIANELVTALCTAAKGGVDVRIITPHKWDKRLVHLVTRTYYRTLVKSGVKIYEYTPGFMHGKTFVADDRYGVVGTINMDYRSLYLHFECGVWLYDTPCINELKNDFLDTLKVCQPVTRESFENAGWDNVLVGSLLRVFAPLL